MPKIVFSNDFNLSSGLDNSIELKFEFIDKFLADANSEFLKVYLLLLRHKNEDIYFIDSIAKKLDFTEKKVFKAIKYWSDRGLLYVEYSKNGNIEKLDFIEDFEGNNKNEQVEIKKEAKPKVKKSSLPPSISDISLIDYTELSNDSNFKQLLLIFESYLNRPLTEKHRILLIYMYKKLNMSYDLIDFLIEYCANNNKVSPQYMEKLAVDWVTEGIVTVEDAKNQIGSFNGVYYEIMNHLGVNGNLTPTHKERFNKWLEDHTKEMILEAVKIAVNQNKCNLDYVEGILNNWKKTAVITKDDLKSKTKSINKNSSSSFNNYKQRNKDYDEEFLSMITRDINEVR